MDGICHGDADFVEGQNLTKESSYDIYDYHNTQEYAGNGICTDEEYLLDFAGSLFLALPLGCARDGGDCAICDGGPYNALP